MSDYGQHCNDAADHLLERLSARDQRLLARGWNMEQIALLDAEKQRIQDEAAARVREELDRAEYETSGQAWKERLAARAGTIHGLAVHYSDRPGKRSRNERL